MNSASTKKEGLGKGLSALFNDSEINSSGIIEKNATKEESIFFLKTEILKTNKNQPRQNFSQDSMKDLIESVKIKGILLPLLVRKNNCGSFELIAGERRLRAAKFLNLKTVPCRIMNIGERESLEIAILENIQRNNLSFIEEAEGYKNLIKSFEYTQEIIATKIGKSRSHISNLLRLLNLPHFVKELARDEKISMGHARALITSKNTKFLAKKIIEQNLSVRETEKIVKKENEKIEIVSKIQDNKTMQNQEEIESIKSHLYSLTSLRAKIKFKKNGGTISFDYNSDEDLDEFLNAISIGYRDKKQ